MFSKYKNHFPPFRMRFSLSTTKILFMPLSTRNTPLKATRTSQKITRWVSFAILCITIISFVFQIKGLTFYNAPVAINYASPTEHKEPSTTWDGNEYHISRTEATRIGQSQSSPAAGIVAWDDHNYTVAASIVASVGALRISYAPLDSPDVSAS